MHTQEIGFTLKEIEEIKQKARRHERIENVTCFIVGVIIYQGIKFIITLL